MVALVAISTGATYAVTQNVVLQPLNFNFPASGTYMTGHVEAVVRDSGGNIIAYRQADNEIVMIGMQVLGDQLFLDTNGNHTNATNGAFGWMNIGNGSAAPVPTDTGLDCALQTASVAGCGVGNSPRAGCVGVLSTINDNDPTENPAGSAQVNYTAIATFDGAVCNSNDIQEAGMWNNGTSAENGQMFARNTFGKVTLTTTDSLELTWRFTFTDQ